MRRDLLADDGFQLLRLFSNRSSISLSERASQCVNVPIQVSQRTLTHDIAAITPHLLRVAQQ